MSVSGKTERERAHRYGESEPGQQGHTRKTRRDVDILNILFSKKARRRKQLIVPSEEKGAGIPVGDQLEGGGLIEEYST